MADDVLRFGKIEIIEWLRPGEMKTGRDLFDKVEPMGIASMPAIGAQYRQVWTRAEFLAALRAIENEFRATGMLPLLHIERVVTALRAGGHRQRRECIGTGGIALETRG
jgi:hypothetical protein